MRTAFALGWRNIADDPRSALLRIIGVAVGVALLTATVLGGLGARQAVVDGVASLVSIGDVGVVPDVGEDHLDEGQAQALGALPGVTATLPSLSQQTAVSSPDGTTEHLTVTGLPLRPGSPLETVLTEGRTPRPGTNEVVVPADVAERMSIEVGAPLVVAVPVGAHRVEVVGVADPAALGVFGRDNVFLGLAEVQAAFRLPGALTRVDLTLDEGEADTWAARNATSLPPGTTLQDTSAISDGLEPVEAAVSAAMGLLGLVVLALSTMLGSAASTAAVRRRSTVHGALRAVGASRRWIAATVVAEVGLVAASGSFLGAAAGVLVASSTAGTAGSVDASHMLVAAATGIGVGVASSALGARSAVLEAARTPPAAAHRVVADTSPVRGRPRVALAASALVAACVCSRMPGGLAAASGLLVSAVVAASVAPLVLRPVGAATSRLHWAADVARRRPSRARRVVSRVLALAVFGGVALTVTVTAVAEAMTEQIDRQFGADVQVTSSVPLERTALALDEVPGVDEVAASTWGDVTVASSSAELDVSYQAVESSSWFRVAGLAWSDGGGATGPSGVAAGGVALPRGTADALDVVAGDVVLLVVGDRHVEARVAGSFTSLATGRQVVVGEAASALLGAAGWSRWDVSAAGGVEPTELARRVSDAVAAVPGVEVVTAEETRVRAGAEMATLTAGLFAVVVTTLVLGAVGASSTFASEVDGRRRELALLRALGCGRRGVRALVAWDAVVVGSAAIVVGGATGIAGGSFGARLVSTVLGVHVEPTAPGASLLAVGGVVVLAVVGAAWLPTRRASAVLPLDGLRGRA